MKPIIVVDNNPGGGAEGLSKVLGKLSGLKVEKIHYQDQGLRKLYTLNPLCLVLSGSPVLFSLEGLRGFEEEIELIREFDGPILGICGGHQLIGLAYHVKVVSAGEYFRGFYRKEVLKEDPIFEGLPKVIEVYESHKEKVEKPPEGFEVLVRSGRIEVEAFRHIRKPIYGVQFHPESYDEGHPHGRRILENFLRLARNY
jgi:GMP synthase (glutamine-hydrolysing)